MTSELRQHFLFAHLNAPQLTATTLAEQLGLVVEGWPGVRRLGVFHGLFGVSNRDVFALLTVPDSDAIAAELSARLPTGIVLVDSLVMRATARPTSVEPFHRAGLHVFRFFDVRDADVTEIVALSATAWETFEQGDGYRAEPLGLFRYHGDAPTGRMLLLTWYDGFESWERSRTPHPEARANFQRRAALTASTIAYATRLH